MKFFLLLASLIASTAAAQGCTTTTTIQDHGSCKGCTKTIDMITATQLVDCGGGIEIATVTNRKPFYNCKVPCIGGFKTEYNEHGTITVTACEARPTEGGVKEREWTG